MLKNEEIELGMVVVHKSDKSQKFVITHNSGDGFVHAEYLSLDRANDVSSVRMNILAIEIAED